jgi:heme exporter protein C
VNPTSSFDPGASATVRRWGTILIALGGAGVVGALWMVFFYAPTEREMGVIQRIYYIHIPTAWLGEFGYGLLALCSLGYLLLRDERLDAMAVAAAETGFLFLTATLVAGPLWAKIAWGAWWVWDARLSFTLILWLLWIGYFMLRDATANPDTGKRLAAITALVGAADLPLIHMSVYWFRTQHPKPVMMNPEGPTADPEITRTILACVLAFTLFYFGLLLYRYEYERLKRHVELLEHPRRARDGHRSSPAGGGR